MISIAGEGDDSSETQPQIVKGWRMDPRIPSKVEEGKENRKRRRIKGVVGENDQKPNVR